MNNVTILGKWVRRFLLEYLVSDRNLSLNTQKSYRDMLKQLLPYLARQTENSIDRLSIDDMSPQIVRKFLNHIEQQCNCAISTRNQRLAGIHALVRYIAEHNPEYVDWCYQIRLIPFKKTVSSAVTYLDKTEMTTLLATPNQKTEQGCREHALLLFLYNSGARATEATSLEIKYIDWYTQSVCIIGKGGKHRRCPLWSSTLATLRKITETRDASERVFLNRCSQPMTRSGVYALVKRCSTNACNVAPSLKSKKVSPHVIRHTTASHLLQAGVDINTIRCWLGHVSLNTTNIYAETNLETKARALATCAVTEEVEGKKHWLDQPKLMEFLNSL
jgi:integrase/recombinase XerD